MASQRTTATTAVTTMYGLVPSHDVRSKMEQGRQRRRGDSKASSDERSGRSLSAHAVRLCMDTVTPLLEQIKRVPPRKMISAGKRVGSRLLKRPQAKREQPRRWHDNQGPEQSWRTGNRCLVPVPVRVSLAQFHSRPWLKPSKLAEPWEALQSNPPFIYDSTWPAERGKWEYGGWPAGLDSQGAWVDNLALGLDNI